MFAVSLVRGGTDNGSPDPPCQQRGSKGGSENEASGFPLDLGVSGQTMVIRTRSGDSEGETRRYRIEKRCSDQELTSGGKRMDAERRRTSGRQGETYPDTSTLTQTVGESRAPGNPTGLLRCMSGSEPRRLRCGDDSLPNRELAHRRSR